MLPDRVSNPGPLTYGSGALPIALRGPATNRLSISQFMLTKYFFQWSTFLFSILAFCLFLDTFAISVVLL